ncbi:magnesium/cobalt transporter CorA [Niallia sp. 01092]|uniref:magnesium/cobalt transporter CorA n=1 Tax=unclassified Niallia TaxID=2837522 RepID=UPI003FD15E9D
MIKTYFYTKTNEEVKKNINLTDIKDYIKIGNEKDTLLWIDLYDTTKEELQKIAEIFDFHPLAIEDCLQHTLRSKVDRYEGYTFFVFNAVNYNEEEEVEITTQELNVFLGENFIVTVHPKRIKAIGKVVDSILHSKKKMKKGADYFLYAIIDEVVDEYFPILERISERIDELEDEMYINPAQEISEEFLALKRTIVLFRRVIQPKKRIFASVGNRYLFKVQEENIPYFMDLVDHLERIADSLEVFRDLVSGAMDTYFSIVSARTNNSMQKLTMITVVTAVIAAITGFFGMNIPLPFQDKPIMTIAVLILLILIPVLSWKSAKKRDYL